jgi:hypothetical protein
LWLDFFSVDFEMLIPLRSDETEIPLAVRRREMTGWLGTLAVSGIIRQSYILEVSADRFD